jgi:tetratricopeptide (TPR) repeat protein
VGSDRERNLGLPSFRWLLGATLALGAVLRAVHLAAMKGTPFFDGLILDARAYDAWAQRIAGGELIGPSAFWIDPLYAYVLGGLYAVLGHDLLAPRVLNALLGLGTALLAAGIALRAQQSRITALAACALVALFVPAIHFESQVEKTALTVFLVALATYLFLGGTVRSIVAAGIVTGVAALARGNVLLFIPIGALALWRGWDREPGDALIATQALRRKRAALFLACALPVVGLATAHNAAATGELVPTTTNLGINLYIGNHLENVNGTYTPPPFSMPTSEGEQPDFRAEAERRGAAQLSDGALSSFWVHQAVDEIFSSPGATLQRTWRKLHSILHNDEIPDSEAVELFAHWSKVVGTPVLWFGQLLPLALLGAIAGFRQRGLRIVIGIAVLYAASLLPFFVLARLRMPLLAPLAVLGGAAIAWLADAVDAKRTRELAGALAVTAVFAVFCYYQPAWMAERSRGGLAIGWHNLGATLERTGKKDEAARAFERAVAVDAKAVPGSSRALGAYYQAQGELERAEAAYRRLVELKPDSASGRASWRGVFSALLRQGETQRALAVMQDAVQHGPYDEGLRYQLGQLMERQASADAMIAFFSANAARDPKPQTSHYFWAVGLARNGDIKGALARLEHALEIDPAHEMSQQRIGMLLEQQGDLSGALEHYEEATRILPEYKSALEDVARVAEKLGRTELVNEYRQRAATADPNSPRRFVHWARYLYQHGRKEAALAELDRTLAETPDNAEAMRLRERILRGGNAEEDDSATTAAVTGVLAAGQRERLSAALASAGPGAVIKLVHDERYASARELASGLAEAFAAQGWVTRIERAPFPLKPGLTLLAATHPPLASTVAASDALTAAALEVSVRSGYRDYAKDMQANNPDWRGFVMADDEDVLVAIGDVAP